MEPLSDSDLHSFCEAVYQRYHRPEFIRPDPLQYVLPFARQADREIAALTAACLAIGRVSGIGRAVTWVLSRFPSPATAISGLSESEIAKRCEPFVYRFFDGRVLTGLVVAIKRTVERYGSLEACFSAGLTAGGGPVAIAGLKHLVASLRAAAGGMLDDSIILPDPAKRSACKRLFLFLRWMVRSDSVDPGGWTAISPSQLMVPVDTHMLAVSRALGITSARTGNLAASFEITSRFRVICPSDPVRYDFSLTRLGIHPDGRMSDLKSFLEDRDKN